MVPKPLEGGAQPGAATLAWKSFATPAALDAHTYGYRWNYDLVTKTDTKDGPLATLPEYYKLGQAANGKPQWVAVASKDVPAETGLVTPPAGFETGYVLIVTRQAGK